jgi:hypothetical protein
MLERVDDTTERLVVSWPVDQLRLFPLWPGQFMVVELTQAHDGLYMRDALLESATTEEPPRLVLRPTAEWQRVQRRQRPRHPIQFQPSQATRVSPPQDFEASVIDLSAGGVRITASIELDLGDAVELCFETPSGGAELRLRLIVVRVEPIDGDPPTWDLGCQFVEAGRTERDRIVQFVLGLVEHAARHPSD